MVEKILDLIKESNMSLPRLLFRNYQSLNITDKELIVLIYLINESDTTYNPSKIGLNLNIKVNEVLDLISNLSSKGVLKIEIRKKDKIIEEHINLDDLYRKLVFLVINDAPNETTTIYDAFEHEFGRTLSPIEYEIVSNWLSKNYEEELIFEALKEAVFNNVSSLNYVDRILIDWKKKGIKTVKEVEKERIKYKEKKADNKELFDYDWLNEKSNN